MEATSNNRAAKVSLPPIPAKRYFTIGEVSELCGVKPHVLRYWEQEFTQLKPVKRRGNRRYYQHHEVLLIRRIRELLYEQGFTISGARNRLDETMRERGGGNHAKSADVRVAPGPADLERIRRELSSVIDYLNAEPATGGAPSLYNSRSVRDVAQPGSVPAWGAGGRWFESSRPDQIQSRGGGQERHCPGPASNAW